MQSDSDMRGAPLDLECFFNLLFNWLGSCNVGHTTMPHSIQYHGVWRLQLVRFIISANCPKSIALLVCRDVHTKRYFLDTSKTWRKIQQPRKKHCFVFSLAMMNESFPKTAVFESFWHHQWRSLPKTIGILFFTPTTPKPFLLISPATIHTLPATLRGPTMGVATGATNAMKDVVMSHKSWGWFVTRLFETFKATLSCNIFKLIVFSFVFFLGRIPNQVFK